MPLDPTTRLQLDFHSWSIARLIDRARELTPEQFNRPFDVGPGSVQAILAHTIEAIFFFADNFRARPYERRPGFEEKSTTPDGLADLFNRADHEFRDAIDAFLQNHAITDPVAWPFGPSKVSAALALAQAFDHASHHKAQVLNMLRRLDALDGLESYPLLWAEEREATGTLGATGPGQP